MDLLKSAVLLIITPECYDQYFVHFAFFHGECMKATISKLLGLIIVAGSLSVKVPQIMKIYKNKSGEGISVIGASLDLCTITSFLLYSCLKRFPFSAWGDGLFLAIQTLVVIGLIFYYKNQLWYFIVGSTIYLTVVFLILGGIIPFSFLWLMQLLNFPVIILAKGIQALTNYRSQSTGQLSAITCWLQFGGASARVFTSIQETGDIAVILIFVVTSILNGIIVFQLLYYAKSTKKKAKAKGKGMLKGKKSN